MPDISVIVPVYRAEDFLRQCTNSILAQGGVDFELLLIDDGSPDGSGALCDAIAEKDARVRVFHQENGGVSAARNKGIEQAQGRYLFFVDADDSIAPQALKRLYQTMQDQGVSSVGCAHFNVEPSGIMYLQRPALPVGIYDKAAIRESLVCPLLGDRLGKTEDLLNGFVWRFLFDGEIIRREGLRFEGAYLEDELFLLEYFCLADSLAIIDDPLYHYLQNPQSVTRNYLPDYMQTFARFMERKEAVVARYDLASARPLWRENSNWSGLLIAVSNVYAPGNPASFGEKKQQVKALLTRREMQQALRAIHPKGLSRNKQMVADLLRRRMLTALTMLYAVKNRGR